MTLYTLTAPDLRAPVYLPGLAVVLGLPDLSDVDRGVVLRLAPGESTILSANGRGYELRRED